MKSYIALTTIDMKLALRDKQTLFFTYLFPLIFFFFLATMLHADRGGGTISLIVTDVLVIGILGNGFFGAGIRAVQEREANILRRYKVTPITPVPLLVASLSTGLLLYVPAVILTFGLARTLYGMPVPDHALSLLIFLSIGAVAFRSIGLIIAAVANSMAESTLLVQVLYMPMLFLSGAMFPMSMLPLGVQKVAEFLPATYLVSGIEGIVAQHETLANNWKPAGGLLITLVLATFVASRLFRWEKEEKLKPSAKLWVLGVMTPFVLLGVYQFRTSEQIVKNRAQWRQLQRDDAFLIRNAKVFVGDGRVLESASVLVRHGKIEKIFEGDAPEAARLKADAVEASGKTLLPGLIDVHVHLGAPGGVYADEKDYLAARIPERALAQYLYSGITTVKSTGDTLDTSLGLRDRIRRADLLGAELVVSGPLFTTEDGHGTEYFKFFEGPAKAAMLAQFVRTPKTPEEARAQVAELKSAGVDAIKTVLESGRTGMLFARMDVSNFRAVVGEAKRLALPVSVHTGSTRDVDDALDAGASSIEHGSFSEAIPEATFARMAKAGVCYDPTLSVIEALAEASAGNTDLLRRSLVQQAVEQKLLTGTSQALKDSKFGNAEQAAGVRGALKMAEDNLLRAWKAGVPLVTGTDAGNMLVFHGPTVHRELQLWVEAGIPAPVALQAATLNAAKLLGADSRIGLVAEGRDANLLLVDGDPLRDISSTERISLVVFKGERVRRADLFDATKNPFR
jgi:imidazolonepropionase-like amidohydrolase/ABC-type multidrug transport system permease subunit